MYEVAIPSVVMGLLRKSPFVGFEVVLADGRVVKIVTSEQAWIENDLELLYVVRMKPADEPMTEIISVRHIAMIRIPERLVPDSKNDCPF